MPTLCDPMDYSPSGSSVHGILQSRILEWLPYPPPGDLPDTQTVLASIILRVQNAPETMRDLVFFHLSIIKCSIYNIYIFVRVKV